MKYFHVASLGFCAANTCWLQFNFLERVKPQRTLKKNVRRVSKWNDESVISLSNTWFNLFPQENHIHSMLTMLEGIWHFHWISLVNNFAMLSTTKTNFHRSDFALLLVEPEKFLFAEIFACIGFVSFDDTQKRLNYASSCFSRIDFGREKQCLSISDIARTCQASFKKKTSLEKFVVKASTTTELLR